MNKHVTFVCLVCKWWETNNTNNTSCHKRKSEEIKSIDQFPSSV